jgi:hypothetical protein
LSGNAIYQVRVSVLKCYLILARSVVLFNFSGGLEKEPMDCKAGIQMTTLGSEFIVKSIFVLKSAATGRG